VSDILDRPAPPPPLTVRYGPRPEHVIDLWLPPDQPAPGRPAPFIVLIHGGFWRPAFDRTHLRPMAHALADAGNVVAVPEYRRAGMAAEGWTGPFDDIAAALEAAGPLAEPHGADTGHLTWAGHSAGGHLALWAAARPGLPPSSPWRGPCPATHVVSLAGCNSLRMCAEWNLGAGAVRTLMGGGPDEVPERYAVADPAALPPPPVPVTLVHGTDDDTVPLAMSRLFGTGRLVEIPGAGHFDLVDPLSPAWPQVLAVLTGIHLPSLKELCLPRSGDAGGHSALERPMPGRGPSFPWPPGT
jgi:acetyl esterase/lipase